MHKLDNLPKRNSVKDRKRVGRGHGSGLVKTSGRGQTGQKSRAGGNIPPDFQGVGISFFRRIPKLGGFKPLNKIVYSPVNVGDLDRFDEHYLHLWIWNRRSGEIAGAYRLGATDVLRRRFGLKGLYTSTLFAFKDEFVDRIDPALELGRSFVRLEYQREFAPLLLLWKGIGAYVCRHPRYRVLFGPVSISNAYRPASRELMVTFLERSSSCPELRPLVRARTPFRRRRFGSLAGNGEELGGDIDELSSLVGEIEAGAKGVPVLLRQYLKMGGKLLAFNVDARFSHALDGLIVVDLRQTDPKMLERYMGKEHAARFLASVRAGSAPPAGGVSQPDR